MKESFIGTLYIKSKAYILRFKLFPTEPLYTITVLNRKDLSPFKMAMIDDANWRVISETKNEIKSFEVNISDLIIDKNKRI